MQETQGEQNRQDPCSYRADVLGRQRKTKNRRIAGKEKHYEDDAVRGVRVTGGGWRALFARVIWKGLSKRETFVLRPK